MSPALPCHWPTYIVSWLTVRLENKKRKGGEGGRIPTFLLTSPCSEQHLWRRKPRQGWKGDPGAAQQGVQRRSCRQSCRCSHRGWAAAAWAQSHKGSGVYPANHRLKAGKCTRVCKTFFFHSNSKISTWNSKAGRGSLPMSLTSALHPWRSTAWAHSSRKQALLKGAIWWVWVSALPLAQPCTSQPLLEG